MPIDHRSPRVTWYDQMKNEKQIHSKHKMTARSRIDGANVRGSRDDTSDAVDDDTDDTVRRRAPTTSSGPIATQPTEPLFMAGGQLQSAIVEAASAVFGDMLYTSVVSGVRRRLNYEV